MEFSDVEQEITDIVFTEDQIREMVAGLARRIEADYGERCRCWSACCAARSW